MSLKSKLVELAKSVPAEALQFKTYGKANRNMATTRTINVIEDAIPVPGHDGKVGRAQITFCVNIMDIDTLEKYKSRRQDAANSALDNLSDEEKRVVAERLLAELA